MANRTPASTNFQTPPSWPVDVAIYHLLSTQTDENHPLNVGAITERLYDYGVYLNPKAIAKHLNDLQAVGLAEPASNSMRKDPVTGRAVVAKDGTRVTVKKGWRRAQGPQNPGEPSLSPLSEDETAYLGHTLFESFELTEDERLRIWHKLRPLTGPRGEEYGEERLDRKTPISSFMPTLSVIHEAMNWQRPDGTRGAKVSFTLTCWDREGAGDQHDQELVVDPLCVAHTAEGSFLVAKEPGKEQPSHFRLDLISGACNELQINDDEGNKVLGRDKHPVYDKVPADERPYSAQKQDRYVDAHPYMREGKEESIHFRVRDVESTQYQVRRMFRSALRSLRSNHLNSGMLYGEVEACPEGVFRWAVNRWPNVEILQPLSLRQRIAEHAQNLIQTYMSPADLRGTYRSEGGDWTLMGFISDLASDKDYDWNTATPLYDMGNHEAGNMVRIENLRRYLEAMQDIDPTVMLVGMAPGRKGTARTGVPFTDEAHLYAEPTTAFGRAVRAGRYYGAAHCPQDIGTEHETSANTIWDGLADWERPPLLWNICPFHLYESYDRNTNRRPSGNEVSLGRKYLERLQGLFGIETDQIWCLGEEAQRAIFPDRPGYHLLHLPSSEGGVDECLAELAELRERYDAGAQEADEA